MSESRISLAVVVALAFLPPIAFADQSPTLPGWYISGSAADKYQATVDSSVAHSGSSSASFAAFSDAEGFEFGTLMQFVDARPYVGERLRFSVFIRTAGVKTGAAAWMRIDGQDGQVLAFDNMLGRGWFREDQSWSRAEIVLDVLPESKVISFGVLLKGEGMIWIDTASLEPVFRHIATTGAPVGWLRLPVAPDELPASPGNLGFEATAEM